jgi:glutamine synthetase
MFLGAGLDGIEQNLDPGDPEFVNMYELSDQELEKRGIRQLPRTLLEAITAFEQDDLSRRIMGDELYQSYIDLKKSEWWSYHNSISQWEIGEYLTKF